MTKFKLPPNAPNAGAPGEAKPPQEPQQETPKDEPKSRERKPIHPGLGLDKRCLKCATFLTFHESTPVEVYQVLAQPFAVMQMAFCECGIWTRDQRDRIRWIRYSSGLVEPGEGEVFAP